MSRPTNAVATRSEHSVRSNSESSLATRLLRVPTSVDVARYEQAFEQLQAQIRARKQLQEEEERVRTESEMAKMKFFNTSPSNSDNQLNERLSLHESLHRAMPPEIESLLNV